LGAVPDSRRVQVRSSRRPEPIKWCGGEGGDVSGYRVQRLIYQDLGTGSGGLKKKSSREASRHNSIGEPPANKMKRTNGENYEGNEVLDGELVSWQV
jgi:hypothetical protein